MSTSVGPKAAKAKGAKASSLGHSMSYNYNSVKEEAKALIEAGNVASALELFEGEFESFVHSLEAEAEKLAQVSKTLPLPAATANGVSWMPSRFCSECIILEQRRRDGS